MNTDEIRNIEKYRKGWKGGLPETECGSGSTMARTEKQRAWLPEVFRRYDIRSVCDVGAGDLNWIEHVDLSGIDYRPLDLVPRHPDVEAFDIVRQVPPPCDAVMCLWVLNHFPFDDCRAALRNLLATDAKYLIMTDRPKWHPEQPPEIQIQAHDALLLNEKGDRIKLIRL